MAPAIAVEISQVECKGPSAQAARPLADLDRHSLRRFLRSGLRENLRCGLSHNSSDPVDRISRPGYLFRLGPIVKSSR